ncbi:MAG: hypothetical protein ACOC8C_01470, partial [Chloroflexota bacterium]
MSQTETRRLVVVILVALLALFVALDIDHPAWVESLLFWQPEGNRDIRLQLGLDLQGGLKVLLAADPAEGQEFEPGSMEAARRIVESRVNSLGLTEPMVQAQGERRIIVELPGIENPEQAVETVKGTALLEFVDAGFTPLAPDTVITTTLGAPEQGQAELSAETSVLTSTSDSAEGSAVVEEAPEQASGEVYETILTGAELENVGLDRTEQNEYVIPFELSAEGTETFAQYTA